MLETFSDRHERGIRQIHCGEFVKQRLASIQISRQQVLDGQMAS
jgi:hypothetical protein